MKKLSKSTLLVIIVLFIFTGCKKNDLAQFSPEIANNKDSFQLQATGLTNVTENLEYSWENSGSTANVDHSTVISSGTAYITILDADGTEVYSKNLNTDGSFTSNTGTAGMWTIKVELKNAKGDINFRVEKG